MTELIDAWPRLARRWVQFVSRPYEPTVGDRARVLDVGCGMLKYPGAVGIDQLANTTADVIHNLDELPYPFDDNTFDTVVARHVIEHLDAPLDVLGELHRITRTGGEIFIVTPHFSSPTSWTDPTHRHHLGIHSFDYLLDGAHWNFYSSTRFELVRRRLVLGMLRGPRGRVIPWLRMLGVERFVNHHLDGFETWWAFGMPFGNRDLVVTLRVKP